jgi:hypothetical protein
MQLAFAAATVRMKNGHRVTTSIRLLFGVKPATKNFARTYA